MMSSIIHAAGKNLVYFTCVTSWGSFIIHVMYVYIYRYASFYFKLVHAHAIMQYNTTFGRLFLLLKPSRLNWCKSVTVLFLFYLYITLNKFLFYVLLKRYSYFSILLFYSNLNI